MDTFCGSFGLCVYLLICFFSLVCIVFCCIFLISIFTGLDNPIQTMIRSTWTIMFSEQGLGKSPSALFMCRIALKFRREKEGRRLRDREIAWHKAGEGGKTIRRTQLMEYSSQLPFRMGYNLMQWTRLTTSARKHNNKILFMPNSIL